MQKRWASRFFTLLLLIALLPSLVIPAHAAYENTHVNTGDQRADIIAVALTQVGYAEGANNYTKYGAWFGYPNHPWCGIFVSWCANQAGIPSSVLKRNGLAGAKYFGIPSYDGASYRPQSGDLFFKKDGSHCGLVYYTEGNYFYTIEGNTYETGPDGVYIRKRIIKDYNFGVPSYLGGGSHGYITSYEAEHPHKEYRFCSHCADKYYTGNNRIVDNCQACKQNSCSHTYGSWTKQNDTSHKKVCTKCSKVVTESHNWNEGTIIKEATCIKSGQAKKTCSTCGHQATVTIPATNNHEFDDAILVDDKTHSKVCTLCDKKEVSDHKSSGSWSTDAFNHWYDCIECGERFSMKEHNFKDGCMNPCADCGYVSELGHALGEKPLYDDDNHWFECRICGAIVDNGPHTFLFDCDEKCQGCDFTRKPTAKHTEKWIIDENGHALGCHACDTVGNVLAHKPDTTVKEWETQLCTVCQFELRNEADHVHSPASYDSDKHTHWGVCICGELLATEAHAWDMQTNTCTVCHASTNTQVKELGAYWVLFLAIGIGASLLILIILLFRFLFTKRD